jgi:hypothetical protein
VHNLITEFDFIPRWRFDDVMISYAATGGSVEDWLSCLGQGLSINSNNSCAL